MFNNKRGHTCYATGGLITLTVFFIPLVFSINKSYLDATFCEVHNIGHLEVGIHFFYRALSNDLHPICRNLKFPLDYVSCIEEIKHCMIHGNTIVEHKMCL